jgi:hypothetical protein
MKHWSIIVLILFWLGWHLALPVDLVRSDLGRHVKNGELILQGHWDVLYKNYYSYTYPQYPFINHHWLFGIFCYAVWHYFGFTGLSFIYLNLELLTFYLFFRCWRRFSSFPMLCAFGLLSVPLISMRSSIRPEGVSFLFCGLFWYLIDYYQAKRLSPRNLAVILSILQVIWVNAHIFFIMGPILTALFWLQARNNGQAEQAGVLQKIFWLLLGMCLINPSGINGFLAPFHMDKAYSYFITENQSVFYYLKLKIMPDKSFYLYFLTTSVMLFVPLIFLIQREGAKRYIFCGILTLFLSIAALKAIRMIGLYGFFWIPLSSYVYSQWMNSASVKFRKNIEIVLLAAGILISASVNFDWKQSHGLGIVPGANGAAEFFKREKISGPIFNNYNIGGYLIFHLSPEYKFFVDNRMEAFPADFFKQMYVPMQWWRDDLWQKMEQRYHFNVIFYSPESTPWGYKFIMNRYIDPSWAVVFYDKEAVIFLKRNKQNAQIIRQFEKHIEIISPPTK